MIIAQRPGKGRCVFYGVQVIYFTIFIPQLFILKYYYILFISLLAIACNKPQSVPYSCKVPAIVLQQEGFTATEWDTIITTVYEPDFLYPIASDTFITTDITNELLITPDIHSPKDFSIFLPSVNRVIIVNDIGFITRYEYAPEGQRPDCYHDISFNLDDRLVSGLDASTGRVYVQIRK